MNEYSRIPVIIRRNQLGGEFFNFQNTFGTSNNSTFNPPRNSTLPTPTFMPSVSNSNVGGTLQNVANQVTGQLRWDSVTGLISQGLQAFGSRPSTQIAGLTIRPLGTGEPAANSSYNGYGNAGMTPEQVAYYAAQSAAAQKATGGLGSGVDGIVGWITSNPLIVLGGLVAVVLYNKEPARRR